METSDVLKLIVSRSVRATRQALLAEQAGRAKASAIYRRRVNLAVQIALEDAHAGFTPEEREALMQELTITDTRRLSMISLRVSDGEQAQLATDAASEGMTVSALIRKRVFAE